MQLIYYHNTMQEIPKIRKDIVAQIAKKYEVEITVVQFKPRNPFIEPYEMITEIDIDEKKADGKLEEIIKLVKKEIIIK